MQFILEFHLRIETQLDKLAAVILPVVQTVDVLLPVAAFDNERCVSVAQKLPEHYQPADHAIVFVKRTDTLETVVKVKYVIGSYKILAFILFYQARQFLADKLGGCSLPSADFAVGRSESTV